MHVHIFFVVVRKGYRLPTSYQNVGVISLIPTSLQSFIHPSILVRELHNMHVHIVLCCGVKTVLFTNKLSEYWCDIINPYLLTKFPSILVRELHNIYSHCSLLWCENGIVYQQVIRMLVLYH